MAITFVREISKLGLVAAAGYSSVVEGVWSTAEKCTDNTMKVKEVVPHLFFFLQKFPDDMRETWNEKILFSRMCDSNVLRFLLLCGKLKRTVRTGWTRYNINSPESVSDHMYRVALMSAVIPTDERKNLNTDRILKMAIVHDLAECIVGDITPHCGVSKEEKLSREKNAMNQLCELISEENSKEIMNLWTEYVDQKTPEAIICKDFDKLEMLLQAYEYENETLEPGKLESFFDSTLGTFNTSLCQKWVKELCSLRRNLFIQCESSDK